MSQSVRMCEILRTRILKFFVIGIYMNGIFRGIFCVGRDVARSGSFLVLVFF